MKASQSGPRFILCLNFKTSVGIKMQSNLLKTMAFSAILGAFATVNADDYRMVHTCKINEGKTMDDVRVANSKWVVFMNKNVTGGGITSHITTIVVGDSTPRKFGYVDSLPSLESWTATIAMAESTAEGMAIDEELQESATCTENQLHKAEES